MKQQANKATTSYPKLLQCMWTTDQRTQTKPAQDASRNESCWSETCNRACKIKPMCSDIRSFLAQQLSKEEPTAIVEDDDKQQQAKKVR